MSLNQEQLIPLSDRQKKLTVLFDYLKKESNIDCTLNFIPFNGTFITPYYRPVDNTIFMDEYYGKNFEETCWTLAHEFQHANQIQKMVPLAKEYLKEVKRIRNKIMIFGILAVIGSYFLSPLLTFYVSIFALSFYFHLHFWGFHSSKLIGLNVEMEKDADLFANQTIGGARNMFKGVGSIYHPPNESRRIEAKKHPLNEDLFQKLGLFDTK